MSSVGELLLGQPLLFAQASDCRTNDLFYVSLHIINVADLARYRPRPPRTPPLRTLLLRTVATLLGGLATRASLTLLKIIRRPLSS